MQPFGFGLIVGRKCDGIAILVAGVGMRVSEEENVRRSPISK